MRLLGVLVLLTFAGYASADNCRVHAPIQQQVIQKKVAAVQQVITPVVAVPVAQAQALYSVGYSEQGDTAQAIRELTAEVKILRQQLAGQSSQPQADTTQAKVEALMVTHCASCHKPEVAKTKGGGHNLLTADGKLAVGVNLAELFLTVDEGRMPKGGPALSDDDVGLFKQLLREGVQAQKKGNGNGK